MSLTAALAHALDGEVRKLEPVTGGDINDAYRLDMQNGERWFVKTRKHAPTGMYAREAEGLQWLSQARALRTPAVRHVQDEFLVLEWIERGNKSAGFDEAFGRGLAHIHASGAPSFGWETDNFIAHLPQANAALPTFAGFYQARRLEPLVQRARKAGLLDASDQHAFEQLYATLPSRIPSEPPARLHGDLWNGNVYCDSHGNPVLIDPAVYGGAREIDLAMLQLFGAPSARFFAAYDEVQPRTEGYAERVALYQLYPLLVHVCLFGGSYVGQLRTALQRT